MTWEEAAAELRAAFLGDGLIRAVASGRKPVDGGPTRAVVRPVTVKGGAALQIVTEDGVRPTTKTHLLGPDARRAVDALLAGGYRNWHAETTQQTIKVQTSKKGKILLSRSGPPAEAEVDRAHDRTKRHLLDPGDPLFDVIGGDARKRRQVDAFLRALEATLPDDLATDSRPLHVVDLGCGNAYLTFAAYQYLTRRGLDVRLTGVDVREDQRVRNTDLARELGFDGLDFLAGTILDAPVGGPVDVVLALHACDTATDEALARAVRWGARWILAAPCCHKDISRQLRAAGPDHGAAAALTRSGILRERFADVLTDALRAAILREHGYAVEVVEFVDSAHTPRNLLLRATATGGGGRSEDDYAQLAGEWGVKPHLAALLSGDLAHTPTRLPEIP